MIIVSDFKKAVADVTAFLFYPPLAFTTGIFAKHFL